MNYEFSDGKTRFKIKLDNNERVHEVAMMKSLPAGVRVYRLLQTALLYSGYNIGKATFNFIRFTKRMFKTA